VAERVAQAAALAAVPGVTVLPGVAPYLLLRLPDGQGERVRRALRAAGPTSADGAIAGLAKGREGLSAVARALSGP
jgi:histidinol-phosphate aminotransferase